MADELKTRIELEALITEREGMLALNKERESHGYALGYGEAAFLKLANEMRKLKDCLEPEG